MFSRGSNGQTLDLDASGDVAPTVTPGTGVTTKTLTISGIPGRTNDMWTCVDALWVHVNATVTQAASASVLNRDKLFSLVDSFHLSSPILGELIPQQFGQGARVGLIDQYLGSRFRSPVPFAAQISATAADYVVDVYYRIPFGLGFLEDPADTCPWAPYLEKSKLDINISPTTASFFQTNASLKASTVTLKSWFTTFPKKRWELHTPFQFRDYQFNTSGNQVKLFGVGQDNGLDGINPGSRIAFMAWLSSNNALGGVDTIEKINRLAIDWRYQKSTQNPESYMSSFLENLGVRAGQTGSIGAGVVNDNGGWPYTMGGGNANGAVLDSTGLFYPVVFPGTRARIAKMQKQIGDLQVDFGFTTNPNGNHRVRTLEMCSFKPDKARQLAAMAGVDLGKFDLTPDLDDGTHRPLTKSMVGLPLRAAARKA